MPTSTGHTTIRTVPPERLRVETVLLDLDGTLVRSNDAHAKAWVDTLREAGHDVSFHDVRKLIGMGSGPLLHRLLGIDAHDRRVDALADRRGAIFRERYLSECEPLPAARELVEKLVHRGFKVVIASSSPEDDLLALLEVGNLTDVVPQWTTADDVKTAKPAPDVICAALAKVNASPHHAVLIGDTPYDLEAARRAGVAMIALRCGGWNDDALDGAIEVFNDPADLLRNWMQTPFRRSLADIDVPL